MLILLNHAGPLEGTMDYNYDLQGIPPKANNNFESKENIYLDNLD